MKAVVIKEAGKAELVNIKEQSMRPDYVKVKTVAVSVNPSTIFDILPMSDSWWAAADFHHIAFAGLVGGILGRGFFT